ncbi:MAG TPA: hypothetical protein VLB09_06115, partial [Nitrospiria bacterium]|nr:hypothetical protein [Nitrospiria bacterium]
KGNVRNLMLNEKVRRAVEQGRFHIYAASTVDEVLEILTGRPAGELQDDGAFPPETLNAAVSDRLREMGERLRELEPQARPEIPAPEEEDELVESGGGRMKGFSPIPNRKRN